ALAYAQAGRGEDAERAIAGLLPVIERAAGWAGNYPLVVYWVIEALWVLESRCHVEVLERNLREKILAPDFRFYHTDARLALARLCALAGRGDEAREWFDEARGVLDGQGARPLRAIADYDEALMYARRGDAGDRERAVPLLEAALAQFRAIGMPGWIRRAEHLLKTGTEWSPATDADTAPSQPPAPSLPDQRPATSDQQPATLVLRCEGDVWSVAFNGATHRIKDSRGLQYLALLFAHPGREFHAGEIVALSNAPAASDRRVRSQDLRVADLGDAGAVLDATATAQYKQRLDALREELQEAEANNDLGRSDSLRHELEMLVGSLASARR